MGELRAEEMGKWIRPAKGDEGPATGSTKKIDREKKHSSIRGN